MKGIRTLILSIVALVILLVGLYACLRYAAAGAIVFGAFATAVVGIVVAIAGRSSVEALAVGGGVKGAAAALLTPAKPEPPAPGSAP